MGDDASIGDPFVCEKTNASEHYWCVGISYCGVDDGVRCASRLGLETRRHSPSTMSAVPTNCARRCISILSGYMRSLALIIAILVTYFMEACTDADGGASHRRSSGLGGWLLSLLDKVCAVPFLGDDASIPHLFVCKKGTAEQQCRTNGMRCRGYYGGNGHDQRVVGSIGAVTKQGKWASRFAVAEISKID